MKIARCIALMLACLSIAVHPADATRRASRRSDLADFPTASQSGYIVPLAGSKTCLTIDICTSSLPPPATGRVLQYLSLARGFMTYSCANRMASDVPYFKSQEAILWDAAPLLPHVPSEDLFHTLVPQLYQFDYAALKNSTLVCIGSISSNTTTSSINIFSINPFSARVQNLVNAPDDPIRDLQWARSTSTDRVWDVYRVETYGGTPPSSCKNQSDDIQVNYASEYWFYR